MTDKKISQLSNATTPLAGTEVLPIVQSSTTVKVASNDLTVRNVRANATTGILQVTGPAAASTRIMTVPDANFTAARTDAANSFTGNQTLADGNLVVGTAAKGIDFSANTHAAGMTSELFNWYEEGTWSATIKGFTTAGTYELARNDCQYTRIGRMVFVQGLIRLAGSLTGGGSGFLVIAGLPFSKAANSAPSGAIWMENVSFTGNLAVSFYTFGASNELYIAETTSNAATDAVDISDIAENDYLVFSIAYAT